MTKAERFTLPGRGNIHVALTTFRGRLTAPRGRRDTFVMVRRIDYVSGTGIRHILEKGNSFPIELVRAFRLTAKENPDMFLVNIR
jgi:hypothetical protein